MISSSITALEDAFAGMTNEPDEVNSSYLRIPPDAPAAKNAAAPEPSAVKTAPSAAVPDDIAAEPTAPAEIPAATTAPAPILADVTDPSTICDVPTRLRSDVVSIAIMQSPSQTH
jgi:hypothetical protein